jgi:hypothetical protein
MWQPLLTMQFSPSSYFVPSIRYYSPVSTLSVQLFVVLIDPYS